MQDATSTAAHDEMTQPLFAVGWLTATAGAADLISQDNENPIAYLNRHLTGDWSEMPPEDAQSNREAVEHGFRVFSSYRTKNNKKLWIITEADRSVTTLLLPEEY